VLRRRRAWFDTQPDLEPEKLVFIDETGASTKMARRGGRARDLAVRRSVRPGSARRALSRAADERHCGRFIRMALPATSAGS